MFSLRYGKLPTIEESQKISAPVFVRNYLIDRMASIINRKLDLNKEDNIQELINEIESGLTLNLKQQNGGNMDYSAPNKIRLTYTRSNLKKGFVFWFICNICRSRAKYLYIPPSSEILACRKCHKLVYERQKESKKLRNFRSMLLY